ALDIAGEQLADFRVVVDDENALLGGGHRPRCVKASRFLLTLCRAFNESIFVAKPSGLAHGQCFDTKFPRRDMFGHAKT
ncbi:MAG: hypothetical protein ACRD9W_11430, partial [Terriglobia bacterium]